MTHLVHCMRIFSSFSPQQKSDQLCSFTVIFYNVILLTGKKIRQEKMEASKTNTE